MDVAHSDEGSFEYVDADVIRDAVGRAIVQCPPRFLVLPVNDSTDLTAHISGSHWYANAC